MLNPFAKEFCPRAQSPQKPKEPDESPFCLVELPHEVVEHVLSFVKDPQDVSSCLLAGKALKDQVSAASLCLDLGNSKLATPTSQMLATQDLDKSKANALRGLAKHMPGTRALHLTGLPVEDSDVLQTLRCLPRLQLLDLGGCRKLTPRLLSCGLPGNTGTGHVGQHPLRLLNLQRCFQMNASVLSHLLNAACVRASHQRALGVPGIENAASTGLQEIGKLRSLSAADSSQVQLQGSGLASTLATDDLALHRAQVVPGGLGSLRCLLLSHLDLSSWPAEFSPVPDSRSNSAADGAAWCCPSIELLALHNCMRVTPAALAALGDSCSNLRCLFLGGCILTFPSAVTGTSNSSSLQAATADASVLTAALSGRSATSVEDNDAYLRAVAAARTPARLAVAATRSPRSIMGPVQLAAVSETAAQLAALVAVKFPALELLELTLAVPQQGLTAGTAAALQALGSAAQVLDLATSEGVAAATQALALARSAAARGMPTSSSRSGGGGVASPTDEFLEHLTLVLRCAANCSSPGRSTPLHFAAERGDAAAVRALLRLGAAVNAREGGGSTPLFLASEATVPAGGHADVVSLLLGAGADVMQANAAGETPLYIAALRGNLAVLSAALEHCRAMAVAWQEPEHYGDGWTPLMAASVANRHDVAACVLTAAGPRVAPAMVRAVNKYGQSALHIAARKGSSQLLRLLLAAGGRAAAETVTKPDTSGDTPMDVARKNRHVAALAEFRRHVNLSNAANAGELSSSFGAACASA